MREDRVKTVDSECESTREVSNLVTGYMSIYIDRGNMENKSPVH